MARSPGSGASTVSVATPSPDEVLSGRLQARLPQKLRGFPAARKSQQRVPRMKYSAILRRNRRPNPSTNQLDSFDQLFMVAGRSSVAKSWNTRTGSAALRTVTALVSRMRFVRAAAAARISVGAESRNSLR